ERLLELRPGYCRQRQRVAERLDLQQLAERDRPSVDAGADAAAVHDRHLRAGRPRLIEHRIGDQVTEAGLLAADIRAGTVQQHRRLADLLLAERGERLLEDIDAGLEAPIRLDRRRDLGWAGRDHAGDIAVGVEPDRQVAQPAA